MLPESLRARHREILRECEQLRQPDGSFSDRERFDQLMTEAEQIQAVDLGTADAQTRAAVLGGLIAREAPRTDNALHSDATLRPMGASDADPTVRLMGEALAARHGGPAASEEARPFRHMRALEMATRCLELRGLHTRTLSPMEIVTRAISHTTSDFPALLGESGERVLRAGYESYQGGIRRICKESTALDFRPKSKLQLSEAPALLKVTEGAEVTHGTVAEAKQSYSLATFGRIFSISRQAIINDDLGAFVAFASRQGRAAAELIASELVTLLTSNPTMGDGVALFHADHGNLGTPAGDFDHQSHRSAETDATPKGPRRDDPDRRHAEIPHRAGGA